MNPVKVIQDLLHLEDPLRKLFESHKLARDINVPDDLVYILDTVYYVNPKLYSMLIKLYE